MTELTCNPQGLVASSCDHGSEHSCSIYGGELLGPSERLLASQGLCSMGFVFMFSLFFICPSDVFLCYFIPH
jgi:hypothetical protein